MPTRQSESESNFSLPQTGVVVKTSSPMHWLTTFVLLVLTVGILSVGIHHWLVLTNGNRFDFYPRWVGGRDLLFEGRNPYAAEVTREIQLGMFGQVQPLGTDQQGFAYPAYTAILLLPWLLLPFPLAITSWIVLQVFLLPMTLFLLLRILGWQLSPIKVAALVIGAFLFRYSMINIVLGQFTIAIMFLLTLAWWAARNDRTILEGLALAAATLKPQVLVLILPVWLFGAWQRGRRRTVGIFCLAMLGLYLVPALRIGEWIVPFLGAVNTYRGYAPVAWPLQGLVTTLGLPVWVGHLAAVVSLGLLALIPVAYRRGQRLSRHPIPADLIGLLVIVTLLALPQSGTYQLALILIPMLVISWELAHDETRSYPLLQPFVWSTLAVPWITLALQSVWRLDAQSIDAVTIPALLLVAVAVSQFFRAEAVVP